MQQVQILDVVYVHTMNKPPLIHWHSRRHSHSENQFEFHYFLHGEGTFEDHSSVREIQPGYVYYTLPNEVHKIHPGSLQRPLGYYAVLFSATTEHEVNQLLCSQAFRSRFPCRISGARRFIFDDLKTDFIRGDAMQQQAGVYKLLSLIYELGSDSYTASGDLRPDEPGISVLLEQAISLFQQNLSGNISLDEVRIKLGVSKEYLIRIFNRHLHSSPMRYYNKLKIEAASAMLIDTSLSVKEIAYELGFSSSFHLSKRFREYTGMPPSEYRKRYYRMTPTQYHTRLI
ncbi:helix-turn-helix domain-containing protein [Spirochaeta dissipatitropha]